MGAGKPEKTLEAGELLSRAPLFSELGKRDLEKIAGLCVPKEFPAGSVIIEEGATGLGLFVITAGEVEIVKGEGESRISLALLHPGDIMGEMALIDDRPRSATAVAREDCRTLLISRESFLNLVRNDADIAWCFVPVLVQRIRSLQERLGTGAAAGVGAEEPGAGEPRLETATDGGQGEQSDSGTTEGGERLREVVRAEYAALMAGVEGLRGAVGVLETFIRSMAEESRLEDRTRFGELARELPSALVAAARKALDEGERLPERMLSQYRFHKKRKD